MKMYFADLQALTAGTFNDPHALPGQWINLYEVSFIAASECKTIEYIQGHDFAWIEYLAIKLSLEDGSMASC